MAEREHDEAWKQVDAASPIFKQSLVYAGVFHLGSTNGLRGSGRTPEVKRKFSVHLHSSF